MELTDVNVLRAVCVWLWEHHLLWNEVDAQTVRLKFRDDGAVYGPCYYVYYQVAPGLLKCVVTSAFRVPNGAARLRVAMLIAGVNAQASDNEGATAELDMDDGELRTRQAFPLHGAAAPLVRALTQVLGDRALAFRALAGTAVRVSQAAERGDDFRRAELEAAVAAALDYEPSRQGTQPDAEQPEVGRC